MSAKEGTIVAHVAKGEGWVLATSIRHRGGMVTMTYTHAHRGTALVRFWNDKVNGLSYLTEKDSSVTNVMASDSWLSATLEVLTGDRT